MRRTSPRNPPQFQYQRPPIRRFFIWRVRFRNYRPSMWRWCCTLCDPPSYGARTTADAWEKIVKISLPDHMQFYRKHHAYVQEFLTVNGYAIPQKRKGG